MTRVLLQIEEENLPSYVKIAQISNSPEPSETLSITIMTAPMLSAVRDMKNVMKYVTKIFSTIKRTPSLENKDTTGLAAKFKQEKTTEIR